MAFRYGAAEHGEILRKDIDKAAVDGARTGDDAVTRDHVIGHAEIDAVMLDIHVCFFERTFIEKDLKPLARGQLALGVLGIDALLPAAHLGGCAALFHFCDIGGHSPGGPFATAESGNRQTT